METDAKKNILFLALASVVLVAVNAAVWAAATDGPLAPIGNIPLWGMFVALNTVSLLWAVSLLGLQPMVVAVSYVAGGFLAYQGVKLLPGVDIAELTTTGATYGAFGALAVSNATTKVRLVFFRKGQVPFVYVVVALLAIDGILNSCVSNPGWTVVLNALVFPFVLAGVIIGLIWIVLLRFGIGQRVSRKASLPDAVAKNRLREEDEKGSDTMHLMIKVPSHIEEDDEPESYAVAMEIPETKYTPAPVVEVAAPPMEYRPALEETGADDHFFPLEIDKDEDFILPPDDIDLVDMGGLVAEESVQPSMMSSAVVIEEETPVPPPVALMETPLVSSMEEEPLDPAPAVSPEPVQKPKNKSGSDDWLSGHLDLLNKIKK